MKEEPKEELKESEPTRVHVCRYQTLQLNEGETKTILDLLYRGLSEAEHEYAQANFRQKKNVRAKRKRLALIINKFEGRTAVPHAIKEAENEIPRT
jgi:uncharacterized protein YjaZ